MYLKDSVLNKIKSYNDPFPHWELNHPLSEEMIDELQNIKISDAPRSFDGTRAADAGGDGIDGKLRVFLEKDNSNLRHRKRPFLGRIFCSLEKGDG